MNSNVSLGKKSRERVSIQRIAKSSFDFSNNASTFQRYSKYHVRVKLPTWQRPHGFLPHHREVLGGKRHQKAD